MIISVVFVFRLLSDINECSASSGVCDVNANCQNTLGSYLCSCKPGYSGDGKTCQGSTHGVFTGGTYKQCVCLCSKYKCIGILKSLNIVNLKGIMTMLELERNVNIPQLLCIVVSVAQNG